VARTATPTGPSGPLWFIDSLWRAVFVNLDAPFWLSHLFGDYVEDANSWQEGFCAGLPFGSVVYFAALVVIGYSFLVAFGPLIIQLTHLWYWPLDMASLLFY
jgi:hypothetical protein